MAPTILFLVPAVFFAGLIDSMAGGGTFTFLSPRFGEDDRFAAGNR